MLFRTVLCGCKSNQIFIILVKLYRQHLVYADEVNVLGGSKRTVEINAEALVVDSKETGLEVNADRTNYMVMSGDQNAGRSQSMKTDNSSFERVEQFKHLVTTVTSQISIQEEIKSTLKSGNVCRHPAQNILSSGLLYKNTKFKIYGLKRCLLFCMGVKLGHSH